MTTIEKRIISIMLVLVSITTIIAYGSCFWREYSLWKDGINIEAMLEGK